ncbi:MAG: hypothetical protein DMF81_16570 [Acidobacteria bacterium]|nr:MAG: hypothetical protein DMF81_16570 [Acidobacteriota bacterium]
MTSAAGAARRGRAGILLALLGWAVAASGEERVYKVVVNATNPVSEIKREQLATLFLNRSSRWSHGPAAAPVDQSLNSPVRTAFCKEVLRLSISGVQSYWQNRIRTDREIPPPVKSSDDEVIAHAEKNKGAVGYVSAAASLPASVKVLAIVE